MIYCGEKKFATATKTEESGLELMKDALMCKPCGVYCVMYIVNTYWRTFMFVCDILKNIYICVWYTEILISATVFIIAYVLAWNYVSQITSCRDKSIGQWNLIVLWCRVIHILRQQCNAYIRIEWRWIINFLVVCLYVQLIISCKRTNSY